MNKENLFYLNKPKRYTLAEAKSILPMVQEITNEALEKYDPIIDELNDPSASLDTQADLADQLQSVVDEWSEKLLHLGVHPKGLWLVDFDFGEGFYCWKLGETDIDHFHGYEGNFNSRTRIQ